MVGKVIDDDLVLQQHQQELLNNKQQQQSKSKFDDLLPILLCGLSIPLSIFFWVGNLAFTFLTTHPGHHDGNVQFLDCDKIIYR